MRRRSAAATSALVVALLGAASACGGEDDVASKKPDALTGPELAEKANAQLEKQNPRLTQGTLTCKDVEYDVGATSRCLRTVVLADGRLIRVGATVTVERTTGGGRFGIDIDERAQAFGVTGKAVAADLAAQYAKRFEVAAPKTTCPAYLAGQVGATITCQLETDRGKLNVDVRVKRVQPQTYETGYTFKSQT